MSSGAKRSREISYCSEISNERCLDPFDFAQGTTFARHDENSFGRAHVDQRWSAHGDSAGSFHQVHHHANLREEQHAMVCPTVDQPGDWRVSQTYSAPRAVINFRACELSDQSGCHKSAVSRELAAVSF